VLYAPQLPGALESVAANGLIGINSNVFLYDWEQYAFVCIVAGGWDIVQRREKRIFAHHRK
jgi:hypothetical protein